jgi:alkanesulfonate monooxygenase SsuD/methylene tetrahydromethanopterin reductase-like flavin-dependent oxidoreductase (luciferase family)
MTARLSIGVAGSLGADTIARLAPVVEESGYHALWVNDTPDGDALEALAAAAEVTDRLVLATGVIPVDRRPADRIADAVASLNLPPDRLVLGIGSGALRQGALARVGDAADTLRKRLGARIVVGALGPRMRRLGAQRGDGVLLNWVPAAEAAAQAEDLHAAAPDTHVAVYVRTALDSAATERLTREADRYASYPNYAANFDRMGVTALEATFPNEAALQAGLAAYLAAVDEVVLRAVTADDGIAALRDFVERCAPAAG